MRNALAEGLYQDIDMKNAHPTLLLQYCNENGIACKKLEEYVSNRDDILETICQECDISRGNAKQNILSILNGGNPDVEPVPGPTGSMSRE
eukprot:3939950-Rhodomonas_salina.1